MSQISIRRATEADASALCKIAESTFREAFGDDNDPADLESHCQNHFHPDLQLAELQDPNRVTFFALAENDSTVIGFTQVNLVAEKECVPATQSSELQRLYVMSEWHGKGVAQQLMRLALITAKEHKSDQIWLGVWEENPKAQRFYSKYGFKPVGSHVFKVGNDPQKDIILAVKLNDALDV